MLRPLPILLCLLLSAPAFARPPVVAVDVGHTLAAPGAISARGRSEFAFNRDLAREVAAALVARGIAAHLVNDDGQIASLRDRPKAVPEADFFLSIHHDSVSEHELTPWTWQGMAQSYSDAYAGHSLFVSQNNPAPEASLTCASAIGARLQRMGFVPTDKNARRRAWADQANTVHWYDNLVVLYRTTKPAVLFEAGVIKHRDEELLLRDPARQRRMADGIATGVAACLQVMPLTGSAR
ncbi:N-acetylmuramoyl-L-alanine amidase family protein [Denitromonas iodatirespirans]|uniref:N-acetylmuramoyl-L-alanine amidase n=1 Tax=Denitromonas iodatirespirans TaxID=2795389 RepID=A0A944DGQ0_DENI1|nr:N-acetylmuramoyl-L-alanine amidase [Denitromonas iodatirespirans]MBT0963872.1 N-acetylmuramoyl-L-alanine amidase [Denitromonas iodatirespirans]